MKTAAPFEPLVDLGENQAHWETTDVGEELLLQGQAAGAVRSGYGFGWQLLMVGLPVWIADMTAILISLTAGYVLLSFVGPEINHFLAFCLASCAVYSLCLWSAGIYPGVGTHPARELRQLFRSLLTGSLAIAVGALALSNWSSPYFLMICMAFPVQLAALPICRSVAKSAMRGLGMGIPFYFLGSRDAVQRVRRDMSRFGWTMLKPVGRFSPNESDEFDGNVPLDLPGTEFRGTSAEIVDSAIHERVYWLFMVGEAPPVARSRRLNGICQSFSEVVWMRPDRSQACAGAAVMNCGLATGLRVEDALMRPGARLVKRSIDVVVSGIALLLLLPLFAAIAALIYLTNPGPVFFSHERIGRCGSRFKAWKFRSMVVNAPKILEEHLQRHPELRREWDRDHKLKNDPRITFIGRVIRRTSLDELPQLWNVFVGEMSLVGPRPIVEAEIEKYGTTFADYLRVTPGITGLWQISGRNNTTYGERLAYDEFYVRHWSPWMDIYILMRTIKTVLFCEGAY